MKRCSVVLLLFQAVSAFAPLVLQRWARVGRVKLGPLRGGLRQVLTDDKDLGDTRGEKLLDWRGSSYSWKRKHSTFSMPCRTFDFENCGTVKITQQQNLEDSDSGTGRSIWEASELMAEYLDLQAKAWDAKRQNLTCVELGAGLGLPSIVAARNGFRVLATEGDRAVLPMLRGNIRENTNSEHEVRAEVLDWVDPSGIETWGDRVDLIVFSDVVFKETQPVWPAF